MAEEEKELKDTTIRLIYPKIIPPPPVIVKKIMEMTNIDLENSFKKVMEHLDKRIQPDLKTIADSMRRIVEVPYGRFDINTFDNCAFY